MKTLLLILSFIFLSNCQLRAQENSNLKKLPDGNIQETGYANGKIIDSAAHKGVPFATTEILKVKDSAVIKGSFSKQNGDFEISQIPVGRYILRISYVGYKTLFYPVSINSKNTIKDLGDFIISPLPSTLNTITIIASKPAYIIQADKRVFDVSQSLTSIGGDATDVLQEIPGINIDVNGNVTLRNGTPRIFVDGKLSLLTLDDIAAGSIDKIEVITNPSARYDAEGKSGIINIILKKNRKPGINGNLLSGVDTHGCYDLGAGLNVYHNPLNFSINVAKHFRNPPYTENLFRENFQNNTWLEQYTRGRRGRFYQTATIGLDYFLDNRNTFSFNGTAEDGGFNDHPGVTGNYLNDSKILDSSSLTHSAYKSKFNFYSGDVSYKHTFKKEGHELTADVNLRNATIPGDNESSTTFYNPGGQPISDAKAQKNVTNGRSTYFVAQADYTNPVNDKSKLETGIKVSLLHSSSVYDFYNFESGDYVYDNLLSNAYTFHENIFAGYLQYAHQINKFSYQLGIRAEQYIYEGALSDKGINIQQQNKPELYPSLFLTYKISDSNKIHLNYSRRVEHPTFWQRIPYINYANPLNLSQGNPELKPDYTNSFELNYNKIIGQSNITLSLYYQNTKGLITTYAEPYNNSIDTTINYFINAQTNHTYGSELTVQTRIADWWHVITDLNLFKVNISAFENSLNLSNRMWSWYAKFTSDMKLPHSFNLQLTGNYNAPTPIPQGEISGLSALNIAVKKSFLKKKNLSVDLSLLDIFNTREEITDYAMKGRFIQNSVVKRSPRFLRCTVTYTFGSRNFQLFHRQSNSSRQKALESGKEINPEGKE